MEASVTLSVLGKAVAIIIVLPAVGNIVTRILREVIFIHKVVACVIGRIYVPTDFDTKRKSPLLHNCAEKGLK